MRPWHFFAVAALLIAGVAFGGWLLSRNPTAPKSGMVQTAQAGELKVTIWLDQAAIGKRTIEVSVDDAAGRPVRVNQLRLRFTMLEMDMGLSEVVAEPLGTGRFQARGQFFSMAGSWKVDALIARSSAEPAEVPFTLAIAAPGEAGGPLNPLPNDSQTILAGQKLYIANCVPCHGPTGKGDGPSAAGLNPRPSDFSQHMPTGRHTDGQIFLWIKDGFPNSAMPAWGQRMSEEQIWQLVRFLRTFGQPAGAQATAQPGQTPAQVPTMQEPLPALIFTRQSNIWRSDGAGAAPRPITQLPDGGYAEYPSFAPAGDQIAFIALAPAPITSTLPLPSSTLFLMNADGSGQRPVWKPAQGLLGMFTWAPDGQSLIVAGNGLEASGTGRDMGLYKLNTATGATERIVADALDPTLSRDGKQLAYLKLSGDGYTMSLEVAGPAGENARQVLAGQGFQGFYAPRFSPDGHRIIVSAIGGPETDEQGNPIKAAAPSLLDRVLGLFEPASASAHGLPWDLWSVNLDGTGLRRLTRFYEDLPMASFSPDGQQVAIMGLGGIYLMQPDGANLRRIDPVGDHGGLDWVPR